jgi:phospholipase/carboxylesterase
MSSTITKFVSKDLDRLEAGQPVMLLLHGYAADEKDLPELMGFLPEMPWASLRAPVALGHGAFAWYSAAEPLRPSVEAIEAATAAIWHWVEHNVADDSQLVVLGFSQGGLLATQLLRTRPERLAATVILAGFMFDGVQPADDQLTDLKPKVFYGRGAGDERIPREAVKQLNIWLQGHSRAQTKTYEGLGHSVDDRVMNDVADFLASQKL